MIPDFEQQMNDKIRKASLKDLAPGFEVEQEWLQLSQRLQPVKKRLPIPVWAYAAATLLLFALAGITWYNRTNTPTVAVRATLPASGEVVAAPAVKNTNNTPKATVAVDAPSPTLAIAPAKASVIPRKRNSTAHGYAANDIIYNGTPCPIELRISQMMKCPNNQPRAISSRSTLEPDQSAQLNYKENNAIAHNCSLTIKEIEIESIATGEVILLNASSTPSTAQEVFSYITREKKGDVLAGMFNFDCDKKNRRHSLRLDNRDGNLILE